IERGRAGRVRQCFVLAAAIRGSARRRAWVRVALRNGTQWRRPLEYRAADTVDTSCDARTEEGTGRFDELERTMASIQAGLFGVGGLSHAAVGLAGGVGAFLTKRSGFSRNARSRVAWRAACTASVWP